MTPKSVTDSIIAAAMQFAPSPVRFVKHTHIVSWNGSPQVRVVDLR